MGAGGENETGAGSSGTVGRVAMNYEASLHRKFPLFLIARHTQLLGADDLSRMTLDLLFSQS